MDFYGTWTKEYWGKGTHVTPTTSWTRWLIIWFTGDMFYTSHNLKFALFFILGHKLYMVEGSCRFLFKYHNVSMDRWMFFPSWRETFSFLTLQPVKKLFDPLLPLLGEDKVSFFFGHQIIWYALHVDLSLLALEASIIVFLENAILRESKMRWYVY